MKSVLRLFKAVPILKKKKKTKLDFTLLKRTIKNGFLLSDEVINNFSKVELEQLINNIEKEIGINPEQYNASFHKSWKKVKEADIEQLIIEQIFHYITTYGFEELGIYDKSSVYIPNEILKIPKITDKIKLIIIKGYTKLGLKEKLLNLLQSGIALSEDTLNDILDIALYIELNSDEINMIKNKEIRTALYDFLGLIPKIPIEFLRYIIYKSTDKTLLIKNKETITEIKSKKNLDVLNLFLKYKKEFGLGKLAEIFYRFKPLFLAFKTNNKLNTIINKIRKLAVKNHKPMPKDFLNNITAMLKRNEEIDKIKLKSELDRVNIFRKIRLAYALKFRTGQVDSILYKIRNGKSYTTDFYFGNKDQAKETLKIIVDSIIKNLAKNVKDKKIYIPDNIIYTLPATEKQFSGMFPSGTYIDISKDMIVGIHWENINNTRIDLDLSLLAIEGKYGWDSMYRSDGRDILFSGDVTDAPKPNGASELFYVKRQINNCYLLCLNYYNFDREIEVPIKIFVAKEEIKNIQKNYMVNPNNILTTVKSKINQKQKILGILTVTKNKCKFYFSESYLGKTITSNSNSNLTNKSRQYLMGFYQNSITLNDLFEKAGAKITSKRNCDIDLSPETLEKDSIVKLLL